MFKKIISNLPFSPTLITELGFYAKRLSKEEAVRKSGLILTVFALIVQSFIVFSPPEPANAANSSDLVYGGIHTRSQLLAAWDNNTQNYRAILQHAGITRDNLVNARDSKIHTRQKGASNGWLSWNRVPRFGLQNGEVAFQVGGDTLYSRPLANFDTGRNRNGTGSWYPAFVGTTSEGKPFSIMKGCANVTLKEPPKQTPKPVATCKLLDQPVVTNRTMVRMTAHASVAHGAAVSAYTFSITNASGAQVFTRTVSTSALSASDSATLKDPGTYTVRVKVHTSVGIRESNDCVKQIVIQPETPKPVATCSALTHAISNRTQVRLTANAAAGNGATITGYTFVIKDQAGKEILRKKVDSKEKVATLQHTFAKEGSYKASVTVHTSLGDKAGSHCEVAITIAPEARCPLNPILPIGHPDCQPCPSDPKLWVKDDECRAKVIRSKAAKNLTANTNATEVVAKGGHRIEYTLTASNEGKADAVFEMTDNLSDVLEYSTLYDRGGATFNDATKVLSWGNITLKPGETQRRTYVIQVTGTVSAMARGNSEPSSYDCQMTNSFGNTVTVAVDCPAPKVVEQVVPALPRTGATENMIIGGSILAVVAFLYFRSRQLNKEVRLIRREVTAGTI